MIGSALPCMDRTMLPKNRESPRLYLCRTTNQTSLPSKSLTVNSGAGSPSSGCGGCLGVNASANDLRLLGSFGRSKHKLVVSRFFLEVPVSEIQLATILTESAWPGCDLKNVGTISELLTNLIRRIGQTFNCVPLSRSKSRRPDILPCHR